MCVCVTEFWAGAVLDTVYFAKVFQLLPTKLFESQAVRSSSNINERCYAEIGQHFHEVCNAVAGVADRIYSLSGFQIRNWVIFGN